MSEKNTGRVTIPTNLDVVPETIELMKRWGADAIRDCDGTEFPEELTKTGAKIYATYYTTRKDNEWAKANPDEVQQCYIMSGFYTAVESELQIPLMKGISDELMQVNTRAVSYTHLFTSADNANEKINITTPIAILYPYNPASFCPYI